MINIQNLSFSYHKKSPLFSNLNLELQPGKICGLLGKNGTGKSTLFKLINGALFANQGHIEVGNHCPAHRRPNFLNQVYLVPDSFSLPSFDIMTYVNIHAKFYPLFEKKKFLHCLQQLDVTNKGRISDLSYGQKKKLLLAFALASNVKYLLMDEPTNGLDIPSKSQFRKLLIAETNDEQAVLISTHQVKDLDKLIESLIIIDNGEVLLHKGIIHIGEKLSFTYSLGEPKGDSIYQQMITGGYVQVLPNKENDYGDVDLEVFFNALMQAPSSIINELN